jgi:putative ABC transport system permease protein
MMTALGTGNRAMFWRILRRLLGANRGRLFVILLALGAGAAVTAALLNLQVDAKRRITTEFRAFGPNAVIVPRGNQDGVAQDRTLPESDYEIAPTFPVNEGGKAASLYVVAEARAYGSGRSASIVVVGSREEGDGSGLSRLSWETSNSLSRTEPNCWIGRKASSILGANISDRILLRSGGREETCHVWAVVSSGGAEDDQISVNLETAQRLADLPHRISLIQLRIPGAPQEVERRIASVQAAMPGADVHGIRQFTEGEAKIYSRISGLLTATVAIVLLLTGLCVMAAMTNVAMERRNDVGLMKAIGGATRRVLRLFLAEAALLGIAGGAIGAAAGIFLSIWLGKQVFGVAAEPRLIVYPIAVALTTFVAVLSAYPLRRLASVRPASVFRGEA